jgi:hypothetical protein
MICTPSFYRGETNARPSSYPERRERRGLSHPTGMESNVQKQKCIIGPCDLMSTHPQQIRQERNRAAVGGLSDLSFVRCDASALLPATAVISCLLRRSIRVGGGGGSRTDGDVPPAVDAPDSPRRIPLPSRGGASSPRPRIAADDRPSPLARVGDRRRRRHHTRYQSPIALPRQSAEWAERGGIVPRVGSDEGGGRAGLGVAWTLTEEGERAELANRKHLNGLIFKSAERRKRD